MAWGPVDYASICKPGKKLDVKVVAYRDDFDQVVVSGKDAIENKFDELRAELTEGVLIKGRTVKIGGRVFFYGDELEACLEDRNAPPPLTPVQAHIVRKGGGLKDIVVATEEGSGEQSRRGSRRR